MVHSASVIGKDVQVGNLEVGRFWGVKFDLDDFCLTGVQMRLGAISGLGVVGRGGGSSSGRGGKPKLRRKVSLSCISRKEYCIPSRDAERRKGKPHRYITLWD